MSTDPHHDRIRNPDVLSIAKDATYAYQKLDEALSAMFGAEARDIHVSHIDHLCVTLTPDKVRTLLSAVGGPWQAILDQLNDRARDKATWKDPGEDIRHREDKRADSPAVKP